MASNGQDADEQGQPKPKLQIYPTSAIGVSSFWRDKYERDAKKYWDVFYKRHQDKFFKDRHYLDKEWGQYFSGTGRNIVLEIGCGAGNTIFPLLATYPDIFVYACDFSPRAIDLVKTHKDFTDTHVTAFVCDLTTDHLGDHVSPSSVDIITMIFVLSAVSPERMSQVLLNIRKVLKPTGYVLFRDYATGDLAQERLTCKDQKISENFYVRGDGTRAFYFSNEFLTSIFKENGFEVKELSLCCKQVENRSQELVMNRRWVQAVFCLSEGTQFSTDVEAAVQLKENNLVEAINSTEFDLSDGVAAEMFGFSFSNNNEIMEVKIADLNFKIEMLSKEYQHTCKSTGLMLWEAAHLMATVLAINPAIVAGKRVLEMGCGCGGICSMVAARYADVVVATDGDIKALELLAQNVTSNLASPYFDKLISRRLKWGNRDHIDVIKGENDRGFDVILGTDVTYIPEAIVPLFATAKDLISYNRGISEDLEPALILCHVIRRVDEPFLLSTASQFGFNLLDKWPSGIPSVQSQNIINSWFPENGSHLIPGTSLNILYFSIK